MPFRVLDAFFPPVCIGCGCRVADAGKLCPECFKRLKFIVAPFCRICGKPLKTDVAAVCGECLTRSYAFSSARAAFCYGSVAKKLILALKYGDKTDVAPWMAAAMKNAGEDFFSDASVLLPVPLHPKRLLFRKYNQAALLADEISKLTGVPADPFLLKRTKATPKQGHFSCSERFDNVKDAFTLALPQKDVSGKAAVLIDDVMTSGATADACAVTLKKAGVRDVRVLTFARAVG